MVCLIQILQAKCMLGFIGLVIIVGREEDMDNILMKQRTAQIILGRVAAEALWLDVG